MSKAKKWIVGIGLILGAVCAYLVATFDGKPETKPDGSKAVEQIKQGIDEIRKTEEAKS